MSKFFIIEMSIQEQQHPVLEAMIHREYYVIGYGSLAT
jgi:hypothetical protein